MMMHISQVIQSIRLLWITIWKFSPNVSHKSSSYQDDIFVIRKYGYINLFMDNHWHPCYHWNTWFLWVTLGSASRSLSLQTFLLFLCGRLNPRGRSVRICNLDRTFPVGAVGRPPASSQPSFGYDCNIWSAVRAVGWMPDGDFLCDISSCDDF